MRQNNVNYNLDQKVDFITHDIFILLDKALLAPKYSGVSSLEVLRPFYILDPVLQSDAPPPHILDPLL